MLNWKSSLEKFQLVARLARPHFLIPGFLLYLLGYLLAILGGASNDAEKFIFGYLIFLPAHLSVSFSNDYFDIDSDKNSRKTAFSGGSKVLVEHPEMRKLALVTSVALLSVSFVEAGIFTLFYAYSWWFFALVLMGGLIGFFYTAPPLKFAYRGLGEGATVVAVGLLMPGMGYFVASGAIDSLFAFFILPISCYGLFFILTVELPDVESDRQSKLNILVRWGEKTGMLASVIATILGTLFLALIFFSGALQGIVSIEPVVLLSLIPLAASIWGLTVDIASRARIVHQVKLNMISLHLLLLSMNAVFIVQVFA